MRIQFLYSPLCNRAEKPYICFLAEKLPRCTIENYNIIDIAEGEEEELPGELPAVVRALRRGEGFLTEGLIFCEGELLGPAGTDLDELLQKIGNKGGSGYEDRSH